MTLNTLRLLSLLFTGLAMAPGLDHLLELGNKIRLSAGDYLVVQQIYRNWDLLGIVILLALLALAFLMFKVRGQPSAFRWTAAAFVAMVGTQIIFWTYTYPVNRATNNWTMLPDGWIHLRAQWEYSHATNAVVSLLAFVALIQSVLVGSRRETASGDRLGRPR